MKESVAFESFKLLGLRTEIDVSHINESYVSAGIQRENERRPGNRIKDFLFSEQHTYSKGRYDKRGYEHAPDVEFSGSRTWFTWALQEFLLKPPSLHHVKRRQEIYSFFANEARDPSSKIMSSLDTLLRMHSALLEDVCRNNRFGSIGEYFSILVAEFANLSGLLNNDLTCSFGRDIQEIIKNHPFTRVAKFFGKENGGVLLNPKMNYENRGIGELSWETKLIEVEKDPAHVDLGLWKWEMEPYPDSRNHAKEIDNFCISSGPLLYVLGVFYWHAIIAREREKKGLPVSMPVMNQEREFLIKEAYPLGVNEHETLPVPLDFWYTPKENKVIIGGAHSGGKTVLLNAIDLYHEYGCAGLPLPCRKAEIPYNARLQRSYVKPQHANKGGLESELIDITETARSLKEGDVYLCDEFLDTTRPEIGNRLQIPVLTMLGETNAAVIIVCHRIKDVPDSIGYRFVHPELIEEEIAEKVIQEENCRKYLGYSGKRVNRLIPTHKFLNGKPDPAQTARHAKEMWENEKIEAQ